MKKSIWKNEKAFDLKAAQILRVDGQQPYLPKVAELFPTSFSPKEFSSNNRNELALNEGQALPPSADGSPSSVQLVRPVAMNSRRALAFKPRGKGLLLSSIIFCIC